MGNPPFDYLLIIVAIVSFLGILCMVFSPKSLLSNMSKQDKWNIGNFFLAIIALFIAGLNLSLQWDNSQKEKEIRVEEKEIRVESLIDDAWDYLAGTEGEPLVGAYCIFDTGEKIDNRQLNLAKQKLEKAAILDPDNPKVIKLEGEVLRCSGKTEEAIQSFEKAIKLEPTYFQAYNSLGRCLMELGRIEESENAFRQAIELEPDDALIHLNLAGTQLNKGTNEGTQQALSSIKRAIEIDPKSAAAHHMLGTIYLLQGKPNDALDEYTQAVFLDKENPDLLVNLAVTLNELGKIDEAIPYLEQAIRIDSQNCYAYNSLGTIHQKKGYYDEAIKHYQTAIYLEPNFSWPYENLIGIYKSKGNKEKAKEFEAKLAQLKKQDLKKPCDFYRFKIP